jgi:hypothetical protein
MKLLTFALLALPAAAQFRNNTEKSLACDDRQYNNRRERFCEIREYPGASIGRMTVDPHLNGGVAIKGWDRADTLVRAKVEAWAPTRGEAESLARQVNVRHSGGEARAEGPGMHRESNWGVSFEIFVPHKTSLSLKAHNGGIHISDVAGDIDFSALNGGVHLTRLAGAVRGRTVNGGVHAELMGRQWEGAMFDVATTNGGVHLRMPENYSAQFEASTVNGKVHIDFPVTVRGEIGQSIRTTIGYGGPLVRAVTTNGGVHVQRGAPTI